MKGVRGPVGVVPRAVCGVWVLGALHLGAGGDGEQVHSGTGHVVLVTRVDQGHGGAVAAEVGGCVQGREAGWILPLSSETLSPHHFSIITSYIMKKKNCNI